MDHFHNHLLELFPSFSNLPVKTFFHQEDGPKYQKERTLSDALLLCGFEKRFTPVKLQLSISRILISNRAKTCHSALHNNLCNMLAMPDCYVSRANPVSYYDENRSFSDTSCYLSFRFPFTPYFSSLFMSLNKQPLFKRDSVFGLVAGHRSISSFKNYRLNLAMDGLQGSGAANKELEEFLQQEQQKLQFQTQVGLILRRLNWGSQMHFSNPIIFQYQSN